MGILTCGDKHTLHATPTLRESVGVENRNSDDIDSIKTYMSSTSRDLKATTTPKKRINITILRTGIGRKDDDDDDDDDEVVGDVELQAVKLFDE